MSPLPRHVYLADAQGNAVPDEQVGVLFNKHWFDEKKQLIGVGRYKLDFYEPGRRIRFIEKRRVLGALAIIMPSREWDDRVKDPFAN